MKGIDYALGNLIGNGGGAGQLWYGSHSVALPIASAGKTIWNISRSLQNGSGGTITINEVGIIIQSQDTSNTDRKFLIVRDKLSNGVDVLNSVLYKVPREPARNEYHFEMHRHD